MRKFFNSLPHGRCYSFQRLLQLFVASWPMLFNIILIHSVDFPRIPGLRLTALLGSFLVFRILLCIMAVACKSFSDVSVTSLVIFCFPSRSWMTVLKGGQFPFSVTEAQKCHPQSHLPYLFWHLSFPSSPLPGVLRVPLRPFRRGSLLLVSSLHLLPNHQYVGLLSGSPL